MWGHHNQSQTRQSCECWMCKSRYYCFLCGVKKVACKTHLWLYSKDFFERDAIIAPRLSLPKFPLDMRFIRDPHTWSGVPIEVVSPQSSLLTNLGCIAAHYRQPLLTPDYCFSCCALQKLELLFSLPSAASIESIMLFFVSLSECTASIETSAWICQISVARDQLSFRLFYWELVFFFSKLRCRVKMLFANFSMSQAWYSYSCDKPNLLFNASRPCHGLGATLKLSEACMALPAPILWILFLIALAAEYLGISCMNFSIKLPKGRAWPVRTVDFLGFIANFDKPGRMLPYLNDHL